MTTLKHSLAVLLTVSLVSSAAWAQNLPSQAEQQQQRDQRIEEVPEGNPASAITKVRAAGLMGGYPDGDFHPERTLTRAQLASILNKTFKISERKPGIHTVATKDVPGSYWAARDIDAVMSRGIMQGYREGFFYPEQRVSRAEALSIFAQAYGVQQFDDNTVLAILSNYPDAEQAPDWSRKALATSLKYGFVDVPPTGNIRPLQPMTRGDMAYALSQYLDRLHESEQKNPQ